MAMHPDKTAAKNRSLLFLILLFRVFLSAIEKTALSPPEVIFSSLFLLCNFFAFLRLRYGRRFINSNKPENPVPLGAGMNGLRNFSLSPDSGYIFG